MLAAKVTDFFYSLRVHKHNFHTRESVLFHFNQEKNPKEGCILYYTSVKAALHY